MSALYKENLFINANKTTPIIYINQSPNANGDFFLY